MFATPIVAGALYAEVAQRAGHHCSCRPNEPGGCGGTHPLTGPACYEQEQRLHVVPIDPDVPWHVAAQLDAGALIALCRSCVTRRTNRRKKVRAAEALADYIPLFDLEESA